MALFLSTYHNKIDKKGRLSVPASFRATLAKSGASSFALFRSYKHPVLECCSLERMELLSHSLDQQDLFSETQEDMSAILFADAQEVSIDGDGRMTLGQGLLDFAGIDHAALFVGRGQTFQIWQPEAFAAYQEEARQRARAQGLTLKIQKPGSQGE